MVAPTAIIRRDSTAKFMPYTIFVVEDGATVGGFMGIAQTMWGARRQARHLLAKRRRSDSTFGNIVGTVDE